MSAKGKQNGTTENHGRDDHPRDGFEYLDPVPFEPTVMRSPPSLSEQVRQMVRSEQLAILAESSGYGTEAEEDDFDLDDEEEERLTPWEIHELEGEERPPFEEAEQSLVRALKAALQPESPPGATPDNGEEASTSERNPAHEVPSET
jgi:hypothetical protein